MRQSIYRSINRSTSEQWVVLMLCLAVLATWVFAQVFFVDAGPHRFSPSWLPPFAAVLSLAGISRLFNSSSWERLQRIMQLSGLLLMVWTANGLLFDFLTMAGLIGDPATGQAAKVYWPGAITRALAFTAAFFLARMAITGQANSRSATAKWYGYAAFIFALPYPVFRIWWALGGTPGISHAGDAGEGFSPVIIAIPWMLAAALSLLLVSPRKWKPRRLLLTAGWSATAIVASIGPAAFWSMIKMLVTGEKSTEGDIATWVFCLFYTSWFLWAIAGFAATRSYQLRSVPVLSIHNAGHTSAL